MTTQTVIETSVREFVLKCRRWPGPDVPLTESYPLLDNGVLDSMTLMELVAHLERQFAIVVEDEDILPENFEDLAAIVRYVRDKEGG